MLEGVKHILESLIRGYNSGMYSYNQTMYI